MQIGPFYLHTDLLLIGFTLTFMLIGLMVTPILPGLVIIWATALGYGLLSGFGTVGWIIFILLTILMIVGSVLDNVLMGASAHKEGAPWWVVLLALLAAVLGSFIIPIPVLGGVIAALLTIFLVEWARRKDAKQALASLKGMLIGWGWSFVFRFIIGVVMIGLWLIWAVA